VPPPGGLGMCPQKQGVSCQHLKIRRRVGPKTLADPQQTRVGKNWGWRGLRPIPGGLGDVPPKQKQGVSRQPLPTCHRVGLKTLANPQQTRVGKNLEGTGGRSPHDGGHWGVSPAKLKLGANSQPL